MPAFNPNDVALMRDFLRRIATGPTLSKDLSRDEAAAGMRLILENRIDPVQAGIFLVALRMKRETDDENLGVLDALQAACCRRVVGLDDLVDLADPFNGVERHLPISLFLAPLLAACGVPAAVHGCKGVGPKHGITSRDVLLAAGGQCAESADEAARTLSRSGWVYLDQAVTCPALDALRPLRELIVKRPCLSTLEKLLRPFQPTGRSHLVNGYVHKEYPRPMLQMARSAGYCTALIVRGTEGTVLPPLARGLDAATRNSAGDEALAPLEPASFGIESSARFLPAEDLEDADRAVFRARGAAAAAAAGTAALAGEPGIAADLLVFMAAAIVSQVQNVSPAAAAAQVRAALGNGSARRCLADGLRI